jgi:hypothetical protein
MSIISAYYPAENVPLYSPLTIELTNLICLLERGDVWLDGNPIAY